MATDGPRAERVTIAQYERWNTFVKTMETKVFFFNLKPS